MEETPSSKRTRDDQLPTAASDGDAGEALKRQRPYEEILSFLDEEEDEPHQDVSYLMTTLQQEIWSPSSTEPSAASGGSREPEGEDDGERVMRHLLEASDDELGLPSRSESSGESGPEACDGAEPPVEGLAELCDGGLWELEDEAANYSALLQSEIFMM